MDNTGTHVIFAKVEGHSGYGIGRLGDIKIMIRLSDGFVNVSKLTSQNKKRFSNWRQNGPSRLLVSYIEKMIGKSAIDDNKNKPKAVRGTYAHPDVAYAGIFFDFFLFSYCWYSSSMKFCDIFDFFYIAGIPTV